MKASLRSSAVSGMLWTAMERFGHQFLRLIIGIIIARILEPSMFGIVGMTVIFTDLAQSILDSGFGSALIQKKDRNEVDYSTCFYFNVIVGLFLYVILFIAAPHNAVFYHTAELTDVIKVISLGFVFNSLIISQNAKLSVELKFKASSIINITSYLISGIIGIVLAYVGFGVWSLVFQQVSACLLRVLFVEIYTRWIPMFVFSRKSFHYLFNFGSKVLVSGFLFSIYNNLYTLVIGRVFTPTEVGHYNRANQFADLPSSTLISVVMKVAYPLMCKVQDDTNRLRRSYQKILRLPIYIIHPILVGLIVLAEPFIVLLIGEKWIFCVPLLQVLAFGYMFDPLTRVNLNILYVKGRTDLILKLDIVNRIIGLSILFTTIPFGLWWLCFGRAFYGLIAYSVNCYYTGKFIQLGFWEQMKCIIPLLAKAWAMGLLCSIPMFLTSNYYYQFILGSFIGIISYIGISILTNDENYNDLIEIVKSKRSIGMAEKTPK